MPDGKIVIPKVLSALALALAAALSACANGSGPLDALGSDLPRPTDYPVHGIDVSKFQGDIDWNAVANSGVKFAWIKATEGGDNADARFQANWEGAKAAGVPRGAYHFVYWCRPPMEEMANFEQNAPADADALPPVLDVEATPTSKTCHRHLTQEGAIADMRAMLEEMERHYGKRPIIYTTVDFYQAILSDGSLSEYPIWVRSTKYHPSVKYAGRAWRFWQYQSDGRIDGISGKVDRDAFAGSAQQWEAFLRDPSTITKSAPRAQNHEPAPQDAAPAQETSPGVDTARAQAPEPAPGQQAQAVASQPDDGADAQQ